MYELAVPMDGASGFGQCFRTAHFIALGVGRAHPNEVDMLTTWLRGR